MNRRLTAILVAVIALALGVPYSWAGGTSSPSLLEDIADGRRDSAPVDFFRFNESVYFSAVDDAGEYDLWRTDGTEEGTEIAVELGFAVSDPTLFEGQIYFSPGFGSYANELWQTDGTPGGTFRVKKFDDELGAPADLTAVNDLLVFQGVDRKHGEEPWISDGTEEGTQLLKDLSRGKRDSNPYEFRALGDEFFFSASKGLYTSDGTRQGTKLIKPLDDVGDLTVLGDRIIFVADGGSGRELWTTDGTTTGTTLLKEIAPGRVSSGAGYLAAFGDRVLFTASDGRTTDSDLWVTDGSRSGTKLIGQDLNFFDPTKLDGRIYFTSKRQLWSTRGTRSSTDLIRKVRQGRNSSDSFADLTRAGDHLYFTQYEGSGSPSLWRSDGDKRGTRRIESYKGRRFEADYLFASLGTLFYSAGFKSTGVEPRVIANP